MARRAYIVSNQHIHVFMCRLLLLLGCFLRYSHSLDCEKNLCTASVCTTSIRYSFEDTVIVGFAGNYSSTTIHIFIAQNALSEKLSRSSSAPCRKENFAFRFFPLLDSLSNIIRMMCAGESLCVCCVGEEATLFSNVCFFVVRLFVGRNHGGRQFRIVEIYLLLICLENVVHQIQTQCVTVHTHNFSCPSYTCIHTYDIHIGSVAVVCLLF